MNTTAYLNYLKETLAQCGLMHTPIFTNINEMFNYSQTAHISPDELDDAYCSVKEVVAERINDEVATELLSPSDIIA